MRRRNDTLTLRAINVMYWLLLLYLIAALAWWYIELDQQNDLMLSMQMEQLTKQGASQEAIQEVKLAHDRNASQYIGEGLTFLVVTLIASFFVYSAVRRQIRFHFQQRNFMMAITHELKTPIAIARLNLQTLRRHKLDPERERKVIDDAISETDRLDSLCSNILLSAQFEAGKYTISKETFDASNMIAQIVDTYRKRYPDRVFLLKMDDGISCYGESLLIRLVISNLLDNAVKYTDASATVEVCMTESGSNLVMEVADTGKGIPDDEKGKVFLKFYRMGDEERRKSKGTGLGLYLSAKIIHDHNGRITLRNNNPSGSVFRIELPQKPMT